VDPGGSLPSDGPLDFGPNVLIFDANMDMRTIQTQIDTVFRTQETDQFGKNRYAYFFKPGSYQLDVQLGFYMTVLGLGATPDETLITGAVRTTAAWNNGNATTNFWRGVENLAVTPQQNGGIMLWAVAQATALRRLHIKGPINLWDSNYPSPNWSSGGFVSDSVVDGQMTSGSQQQFLVRNSTLSVWAGGVWNMVFVGTTNTPTPSWPAPPYTIIPKTPAIREKPYLTFDPASASYSVVVPGLRLQATGPTWNDPNGQAAGDAVIGIDDFYVAHADKDTAESMTLAVRRGKHLLLTPGIYSLSRPIEIERPHTVVLGLGMATLTPVNGTAAILAADADGLTLGGILLDAGAVESPTMLQLGPSKSAVDHSAAPPALFDVSCRVGGASAGSTKSCVTVNVNDALLDNIWMWRADHGNGVGWTTNPSANGIIIEGDRVTAYGLFVEHFQEYQTLWKGEAGTTYFYQSEIPYDVPQQSLWTHDGVKGYASYKVDSAVQKHEAQGMGVYCVFYNPVQLDSAIEAPASANVVFHHMTTQWLGVSATSSINHIFNETGAAVIKGEGSAYSAD
jgi:hypothetical protein